MADEPMRLLATPWPDEPLVPRPRLLYVAAVEPRATFAWEEHRHDTHEVIVIERGEYRCRLNGTDLRLGPGMLLAVKPGDRHQDRVAHPSRFLGLGFALVDARGKPASLLSPDAEPEQQVGRDPSGSVLAAVRRLVDAGAIGRHARALARAALDEAMWRVAASLAPEALARPFRDDPADRAFAERLAACFRASLARTPSVAELAETLGVSPSALTQRCRVVLGAAPLKAYAAWRMDHAAALLLHGGLTVRAVAESLGYADQFHFSRAFKRHHGRPPSHVR